LNILVTGSAGFIGSHLVDRLLTKGHTVHGIDKKCGTSTSDMSKIMEFSDCELDLVVHLGANCSSQVSLRDPAADFIDNVVGTFNVCEFSRIHGKIPIIFNSSMKVYPGDDGIVPPYGLSKQVGEMYLRAYNQLYDVPYIINRPSSVYGPGQSASEDGGWLTWFVIAAVTKQPIRLFGDGTQSRDCLYIDDHVDLLAEQIEHFHRFENEDFDFGGGEANELSLLQALEFLNYDYHSSTSRLPGDVHRFVCDNEKLKLYSSWRPKTHWEQGIEKTVKYNRSVIEPVNPESVP
jgi:nucleoside-diphosphate-sugar epimerase